MIDPVDHDGAHELDIEPPPVWFRLIVGLAIVVVLGAAAASFYGW